jgi:hypothetical protein
MALARGESTSSASVAEEHSDPVEPCLPSQGREAVSRASLVEASGTISRL